MDIAEKRVYDGATGRSRVAVASDAGLAVASISGDRVGEFGLALREPVRDVADAGPDRVLVATVDTTLLFTFGESLVDPEAIVDLELESPVAVGVTGGDAIAATDGGRVYRTPLPSDEERGKQQTTDATGEKTEQTTNAADGRSAVGWQSVGTIDVDSDDTSAVRSVDGPLLAAADGVYRVTEGGLVHAGLDDARDVAAAGPLAGTPDGCFRLGNGWLCELDHPTDLVAAGDRFAHAASGTVLYAFDSGEWETVPWPADAPPAGIAYEGGIYAVATDGTVLVDAGDGWRTRLLGLPGIEGCVIV